MDQPHLYSPSEDARAFGQTSTKLATLRRQNNCFLNAGGGVDLKHWHGVATAGRGLNRATCHLTLSRQSWRTREQGGHKPCKHPSGVSQTSGVGVVTETCHWRYLRDIVTTCHGQLLRDIVTKTCHRRLLRDIVRS